MSVSKRYLISKKRTRQLGWKTISREEKNELSRLVRILGITALTLLFIYYIGINGVAQLAGFWSIFTGKSGGAATDNIAAPPPTFAPVAPYTRTGKVDLSGYAEPASEITLFVNDTEFGKTVAEAGGTFFFSSVEISEGKNVITATATDRAGNTGQKSAELIITLDRKPPELVVSKPSQGQTFTGEQKQIDVEGTSELGATVKVNDIQATMLADGVFKAGIVAGGPGEIKLTVIATDKAGNENKVELTVTYTQ